MYNLDKPPLGELAHYGKKGMKWGIRKGYVNRTNEVADAAQRVGDQQMRTGDRLRSGTLFATQSMAKARAKGLREHADRIKTGNAKISDLLVMYGSFRSTDIQRQRVNYGKKKK